MDKRTAAANLRLLGELLDAEKIPFWLSWGTCLGAVRDQDIIAHDYDIDIELFDRDKKRLLALEPTLTEQGFQISYPWGSIGLKLRRSDEDIDIFFCKAGKRNGKPVWLTGDEVIEEDFFTRLETVNFLGREYQVPHPPQAYLRYVYGDDWAKKNEAPSYWSDGLADEGKENNADSPRLLETFRLLKDYLGEQQIPFCLLGHSCRAAVLGTFGTGSESLVIGVYGTEQKRFLEGLPKLLSLGFTVQRASYMRGSVTQLLYEGQPTQVKYLFVPELSERIKSCRWICRWERFPQDFFSKFEFIQVQGETVPVPQRTREYLDFLYGADFWSHPDFQTDSASLQNELAMAILSERMQLELPVKEPWLPFRDNFDNLLIPYGDTLLIRAIEKPSIGMMVVNQTDERLELRQIVELAGDLKGEVGLGDLSGRELIWVPVSNLLGQAVELRSRRLKCTISLKSKVAQTVIKAILPAVRYLKK